MLKVHLDHNDISPPFWKKRLHLLHGEILVSLEQLRAIHLLAKSHVSGYINGILFFACCLAKIKGELRCKNELFSEKRAVREGSILTTCLVFLSFVPYIFWLKRSRKSSLDFRHLGRFLSHVVLTSSCL